MNNSPRALYFINANSDHKITLEVFIQSRAADVRSTFFAEPEAPVVAALLNGGRIDAHYRALQTMIADLRLSVLISDRAERLLKPYEEGYAELEALVNKGRQMDVNADFN